MFGIRRECSVDVVYNLEANLPQPSSLNQWFRTALTNLLPAELF